MSIGNALLGPARSTVTTSNSSTTKQFRQERPLHYGQVYSTLNRLLKNGLVEDERRRGGGSGPEATRDHRSRVTNVKEWLKSPENPSGYQWANRGGAGHFGFVKGVVARIT